MKIAISGSNGRMGRAVKEAVAAAADLSLVAEADDRQFDPKTLAAADAVIDFSAPEASLALAEAVAATGHVHVIGTTGFTPVHIEKLRAYGTRARIVQSGNFSLGVNMLAAAVEKLARELGLEYDIEVDEMHHRLKKDAPSGTALLLAESAAKGRGIGREAFTHYREGVIGERKPGTIGLSVRRGGDVVGVHTVTFAGPGENLELTHRGFSRAIYAHGALAAARWAFTQPPGFYSMRDVLRT